MNFSPHKLLFLSLTIIAMSTWSTSAFAQAVGVSSANQINRANEMVRKGNFDGAIEQYQQVQSSEADRDELNYNQAVAQYRKGDIQSAQAMFAEAASSNDTAIAASSRYNLGNCVYSAAQKTAEQDKPAAIEQLREAISHYRDSLRLNSENADARANIELTAELIRKLQEEQKQEEQQKQDRQDQQQQNQNQEKQQNEDQQNQSGDGQSDQQKDDQQKDNQQNQDEQSEQQQGSQGSNSQDQKQDSQEQQGQSDKPESSESKSDEQKSGDEQSDSKQSEPQQSQDGESKDGEPEENGSQGDQSEKNEKQADQKSEQSKSSSEDQQPQDSEGQSTEQQSDQQSQQQGSASQPQNQNPAQPDQPQSAGQQPMERDVGEEEMDENNQAVPTGDLTSVGQQDENGKPTGTVAMADPNAKDGLMTKEEALKMLQAVRDRDMLRRLRQEQAERSRHVPVDRDW